MLNLINFDVLCYFYNIILMDYNLVEKLNNKFKREDIRQFIDKLSYVYYIFPINYLDYIVYEMIKKNNLANTKDFFKKNENKKLEQIRKLKIKDDDKTIDFYCKKLDKKLKKKYYQFTYYNLTFSELEKEIIFFIIDYLKQLELTDLTKSYINIMENYINEKNIVYLLDNEYFVYNKFLCVAFNELIVNLLNRQQYDLQERQKDILFMKKLYECSDVFYYNLLFYYFDEYKNITNDFVLFDENKLQELQKITDKIKQNNITQEKYNEIILDKKNNITLNTIFLEVNERIKEQINDKRIIKIKLTEEEKIYLDNIKQKISLKK